MVRAESPPPPYTPREPPSYHAVAPMRVATQQPEQDAMVDHEERYALACGAALWCCVVPAAVCWLVCPKG